MDEGFLIWLHPHVEYTMNQQSTTKLGCHQRGALMARNTYYRHCAGQRSQLFGRWTPIQQSSHPPTLTDVHNKEYTMSPRHIISTLSSRSTYLHAIEIKWGCHETWSAITQSKITMAGDTLYAKEYSTIICKASLIRRQLTTGNNHHNLSNDSTNYATVLIATNLKLKDLRRCHHSGLTPPTTNRRMYQPQSHVPKMQIECQLTRASHSSPDAHTLQFHTPEHTPMAIAQLHHN